VALLVVGDQRDDDQIFSQILVAEIGQAALGCGPVPYDVLELGHVEPEPVLLNRLEISPRGGNEYVTELFAWNHGLHFMPS
jgi:hypothetical protein